MKHKIKNFAAIDARIKERIDILKMFTEATMVGDCRSLIVSSPPGLGKSFLVEKTLDKWDPTHTQYNISKGYVLTTGLLRLIYGYRQAGQVLVFDDADSIFFDPDSLNLLKAVCDTTERRIITYRTERSMICEITNEVIPSQFEVESSVLFLTNFNFDRLIDEKHKLSTHLAALVSRSHYIDLAMDSHDDYIVRIEQVRKEGLFSGYLKDHEADEVMDFIYDHRLKLRELSLRMAIKLAGVRKLSDARWRAIATVTCCRL